MGIQYKGRTIKDVYYGGRRIYKGVQGYGANTPKVFWDSEYAPLCFSSNGSPIGLYVKEQYPSGGSSSNADFRYKVGDDGNWAEVIPSDPYVTSTPTLISGTKVYLRNLDYDKVDTLSSSSQQFVSIENSSNLTDITLTGNVKSLVLNPSVGAFRYLFQNYTPQSFDASGLTMCTPTSYMCFGMFEGSNIKQAIQSLPDTTASDCYRYMYRNCTKLLGSSIIPAEVLSSSCCLEMYKGCTRLLTMADMGNVTSLSSSCCANMYDSCSSLITVYPLTATTPATSCYQSMFENCTSLTEAPEIHLTNLNANFCCRYMFRNCVKLNRIKVHFTSWGDSYHATDYWVQGVASSGTFYKPSALPEEYGDSRIPVGWTVVNID